MKIVMISVMMPAAENIRGTSALPFHLLAGREKNIEVILYSYNLNGLSKEQIDSVAKELDIKIHMLPVPWWYNFILKFLSPFRFFMKFPIGNYFRLSASQLDFIVKENADGIWIYGEELSCVSKQLKDFKRVHTLPDCESLYYYRMLGKRFTMVSTQGYLRIASMYPKYLGMERNFDTSSSVYYHLVGEADVAFLKEINPEIQARFLRHPHYHIAVPAKSISFSSPKIKILIAGQYNIYMRQDSDDLVKSLVNTKSLSELKNHYIITFLGKGWESHVKSLSDVGYEVCHIKFAPDYIDEICKHDIQITPISIGTGTKGKVLDAIANGLLVIGSWYALENIAVEDKVSCLQYNRVNEVATLLQQIYSSPSQYEDIAEKGRQAVLSFHAGSSIAQQLYSLFYNKTN
nr:glycosyltransferase [uncultured Prevotella sp.]